MARIVLKPGSFRWFWTLAFCASLLTWIASGWFLQAEVTESFGQVTLVNGGLQIKYSITPTLPKNMQVTSFAVWPTRAECGVRLGVPADAGLRWWYYTSLEVTAGTGTMWTSGPGGTMTTTMSGASFRRIVMVPIWPFPLSIGLVAGLSWRRRLRFRAPGQCIRCGYDRRGLIADAPCPECGKPPGSPP